MSQRSGGTSPIASMPSLSSAQNSAVLAAPGTRQAKPTTAIGKLSFNAPVLTSIPRQSPRASARTGSFRLLSMVRSNPLRQPHASRAAAGQPDIAALFPPRRPRSIGDREARGIEGKAGAVICLRLARRLVKRQHLGHRTVGADAGIVDPDRPLAGLSDLVEVVRHDDQGAAVAERSEEGEALLAEGGVADRECLVHEIGRAHV